MFLIILVATWLRVADLTSLPPSPYWEEVVNGYDAYSILKTGRDHHGNWLPIVALESYGDWKPALYAYTIIPFISIFGLSTLAVRLPSVIAGVLIVVGIGIIAQHLAQKLMTQKVTEDERKKWRWLPLVAMAIASISPWLIQFSRGGWEVNVAVALIVWGIVFGLTAVSKYAQMKPLSIFGLWLGCGVLLILSMYAYHAARIVAPLIGISLVDLWIWEYVRQHQKQGFIPSILSFINRYKFVGVGVVLVCVALLWPLITNLRSPEVSQRFGETSIFNELKSESISEMSEYSSAIARVMTHPAVLGGKLVLQNFLSHFDLNFLFLSGDINVRHSIQYMGHLYHVELVFLLLGIYVVFKRWNVFFAWLGFWLIVGIIPASITAAAPHALRTLVVAPVFLILIALGILELVSLVSEWLRKSVKALSNRPALVTGAIALLIVMVYVLEFGMYWRYYTQIYSQAGNREWQYGYQELVSSLESYQKEIVDQPIFVSRNFGRPVMYFLFYTQADPQVVQEQEKMVAQDQGEMLRYNNYFFVRDEKEIPNIPSLVAFPSKNIEKFQQKFPNHKVLKTITDLKGEKLWHILRIQ